MAGSYPSGKMTVEDYAELKDLKVPQILEMDELIALSDSFVKEAGIQVDLSEYEGAVSSWKEYMEGLSGDTESAAADELFDQLPLENRADYLEAAYNVDNAIWTLLISVLGDSWGEAAGTSYHMQCDRSDSVFLTSGSVKNARLAGRSFYLRQRFSSFTFAQALPYGFCNLRSPGTLSAGFFPTAPCPFFPAL